jgi:hypothetical protein
MNNKQSLAESLAESCKMVMPAPIAPVEDSRAKRSSSSNTCSLRASIPKVSSQSVDSKPVSLAGGWMGLL